MSARPRPTPGDAQSRSHPHSSNRYFFTGSKGGPLGPAVWTTKWTAARQQVGVEHVRLHDLRHLAGTLAAATGAGTKMHRLGHASPRAALIYQHATGERDSAIAEAMNEHILRSR